MSNVNWFDSIDCLKDKAIVDLVNGLDVSRDHQKVIDSQGFLSRVANGFSGKNQKRQGEVNKVLTEGLESTVSWLTELTESVTTSNLAIQKVNERVDNLSNQLVNLTGNYLSTRSKLQQLSEFTSERLSILESDILNLRLEVKAKTQLDLVFSKWAAGEWHQLPVANRCFITLEELRWGSFGDFIRSCAGKDREDYLMLLKNRVIEQLALDNEITHQERIDANLWIMGLNRQDFEAIQFLGNWSLENKHPSTFFITQEWQVAPLLMPRIISASKLGNTMVQELFYDEAA